MLNWLMLVQYCIEALKQAIYKQLEDASWFAEIPGFQGVWANAGSVEVSGANDYGHLYSIQCYGNGI
jgi:hypothetical protein